MPKGNDALILTEWTKKHFGEEDIDSNTVDPTLGEADMEFVLEARRCDVSIPFNCQFFCSWWTVR